MGKPVKKGKTQNSIILDTIDKFPKEYRKDKMSPEELRAFYERANGKAEVTDSPIDWFIGGGATIDIGKGLWALGRIAEDKIEDAAGSAILASVLKTSAIGVPMGYGANRFIKALSVEKKEDSIEEEALATKAAMAKASVKPIMAMGGKIGNSSIVELEGGEMIETPLGETKKIKGKSHSEGGVDMFLPEGTLVFSDKIKIKGKTMAERKEERSNKILDLLEKGTKYTSGIARNSIKRSMAVIQQEEATDLAFQEAIGKAVKRAGEYPLGTGPDGIPGHKKYSEDFPTYTEFDMRNYTYEGITPLTPKGITLPKVPELSMNTTLKTGAEMAPLKRHGFDVEDSGFTLGDKIGMASQLFGGISQLVNTIQNAKATKPNVNRFEGFNDKALQSNTEELDNLGYSKANSLRDIARKLSISRNSALNRNRNSATGMNSLRALDLAVDTASNEAMVGAANQIEQNYLSAKGQLLGSRTQLLSQKDQMVMSGAERKDANDQADIDNLYTQFGVNFAGLSEAGQGLAKSLYENEYKRMFLKILPTLNKYGVGYDAKGNLIAPEAKEEDK